GAFASLGEAGLDQRLRIGKARDFLAGRALAAEIVFQALAIRGLRKHSGESELPDSAGPGEEQCAGNAVAPQHSAQGADDPFVAEKFAESHRISLSRLH